MESDEQDSEDEINHLRAQLECLPVWKRNRELCCRALEILEKWHVDFDSSTWNRIRRRAAKELNEVEPCITYTVDFVVSRNHRKKTEKVTVVDVCSGFGICSMFLSELLPPESVSRIWLLDKMWPCTNAHPSNSPVDTRHIYERTWPIPLRIRKTNIKKSREVNQLHQHVFDQAPGRVILLGVHLCKALSVHAIKMYESCDKVDSLVLKPCCLPGKGMARRKEPIVWKFENGYEFGPRDVYREDRNMTDADERNKQEESAVDSDGEVTNEEVSVIDTQEATDKSRSCRLYNHVGKNCSNKRFSRWVHHLTKACEGKSSNVRVAHIHITLHHFQNQYIFCERIHDGKDSLLPGDNTVGEEFVML